MGPFAIALMIEAAAAGTIPTRTPIGSLPIAPSKVVTHVEMTRVDFLPGQIMPEHMHPVPVAGVVSKGSLAVSIGRDPVMRALRNELRSALNTAYPTGASSSYLSQAGIEFTQTGTLQLNQSVFNDAVTNGTVDLSTLFTGGTNAAGGTGAFGAINDLLTSYTQGNGTLSNVQDQLNSQVTRLTGQIDAMQARLDIQRASLQAEFTAADTAMAQMQSQSGSLANLGSSLTSSS